MIDTLLDLLGREMDQESRRLADLLFEQQEIRLAQVHWRGYLTGSPAVASGTDIAGWLNYGEKANRELKKLVEKDLVVETRISECRTTLLGLKRQHQTLTEVLDRRERAQKSAARRRQEREQAQHGAAREAAREGQERWP